MLNSITTFFKLANPGLFFVYFRSSFQTNIITIFTTNKCEKCSSSIRDSNPRPSEREPTFNLLARLQLEFLKVSKSLNWVNNNDLNSFLESFFNPNFFWELIFSHSLSLSHWLNLWLLKAWADDQIDTFQFWKMRQKQTKELDKTEVQREKGGKRSKQSDPNFSFLEEF